jgi:hypothetical protein
MKDKKIKKPPIIICKLTGSLNKINPDKTPNSGTKNKKELTFPWLFF